MQYKYMNFNKLIEQLKNNNLFIKDFKINKIIGWIYYLNNKLSDNLKSDLKKYINVEIYAGEKSDIIILINIISVLRGLK